MKIYAETSAVLNWLLGEPGGEDFRNLLAEAETVCASDLTLMECDRVLIRAQTSGLITEADVADRQRLLNRAAAHWYLLRISDEIVERARRPFPREPVRTLDAVHLSSALLGRSIFAGLAIVSSDQRIRDNSTAMGFAVFPQD